MRPTTPIWTTLSMVLGMAMLIPACRAGSPTAVSLATLTAEQENYLGRLVKTEGLVRPFIDPSGRYFVIEDPEGNRVGLVPASRVAAYEGRRVQVVGRFEFNQTVGRLIDVDYVLEFRRDPARSRSASRSRAQAPRGPSKTDRVR